MDFSFKKYNTENNEQNLKSKTILSYTCHKAKINFEPFTRNSIE